MEPIFKVGDSVSKVGGDYCFDGIVRSVFAKGSGVICQGIRRNSSVFATLMTKLASLANEIK